MFSGVIIPSVTFLKDSQEIDFDAQRTHTEFLIQGEADAIFIMGSAGEGVCLCDDDKVRLAEKSAEFAAGRVKLLAGVSQESTIRCKKLIDKLGGISLDAFAVTLPYYFPISNQSAIIDFYSEIADYSPKPIFAYNIPCFTGAMILPETTAKLALHPNIAGIKDSCPDLSHTLKMIRRTKKANPAFDIFIGEESIIASLAGENFDGIVPVYGNIFPEMTVKLFRGIQSRNYELAVRMQAKLNEAKMLFPCADTFYAALKACLSMAGTGTPTVLSPVRTATPEQMRKIKKFYAKTRSLKAENIYRKKKNITAETNAQSNLFLEEVASHK